MIFLDIDGTILNRDNQVPASAVTAINECRKNGNLCIVNTGRPFSHIEHCVTDIGFDGFICSCGEHIILNGQTVYRETLKPELCKKIVADVRRCKLDAFFESEEGYGYTLAPGRHNWEIAGNIDRFKERGYPAFYDIDINCQFDKFCIWAHDGKEFQSESTALGSGVLNGSLTEEFLKSIEADFEIIPRGEMMYECVVKGCSKETGIRKVMELTGAAFENTYAVGDSTNDLPMLRCVRYGIAMGNAPDIVKKEAAFVTKDINEDGLSYAISLIT